jgi:hypothetical protein
MAKTAPKDVARAKAELEKATDILFKAWGDWYRAPPTQTDRAKADVAKAEKEYREAQEKLDAVADDRDFSTR